MTKNFFLEDISDISLCRQHGETIIIIVEPEFAAESRLAGTLHTNTVDIFRNQLKRQHEIVIINCPIMWMNRMQCGEAGLRLAGGSPVLKNKKPLSMEGGFLFGNAGLLWAEFVNFRVCLAN